MKTVYCAVRTGYLNRTDTVASLRVKIPYNCTLKVKGSETKVMYSVIKIPNNTLSMYTCSNGRYGMFILRGMNINHCETRQAM